MRDRWSRSRATFRNTYPSRPVATDASRATPDCGLDDRHAPPRSFGIGVAPHAGTAGEQASSMPPSSTSAGCGRIDGTPETSRRTRHTPTPTRRSPVFDPKTGHGGRRGAEYRPHEPRLPPRPSWKTRCPRQESSRVFVYFEAAIVADERATRPVSADLSSDPGSGDLGGSGVHLGRCQHLGRLLELGPRATGEEPRGRHHQNAGHEGNEDVDETHGAMANISATSSPSSNCVRTLGIQHKALRHAKGSLMVRTGSLLGRRISSRQAPMGQR